MARTRSDLSKFLREILGNDNVYFEPPARMHYPCIRYERRSHRGLHADNIKYQKFNRWGITLITTDPDDPVSEKLQDLNYCRLDREYSADGLKHFIFDLYF